MWFPEKTILYLLILFILCGYIRETGKQNNKIKKQIYLKKIIPSDLTCHAPDDNTSNKQQHSHERKKMNNDINNCIADLLANYTRSTLLDYASDDDGAYTIQAHGADWPIDVIGAALAVIAD